MIAGCLLLAACGHPRPPQVWLWAWERPEDLRWVDPARRGVAVLAATVWLKGETVRVEPRRQPVALRPETRHMAVVRIESRHPVRSAEQMTQAVTAIERYGLPPGVDALQIDFDAVASERTFYRGLLEQLRPKVRFLSMTALASWCLDDGWIAGLPVDEAVPMLFRMGPDERSVRAHLDAGGDFRVPLCRTSWGISSDAPPPRLRPGRRLYVFHPRPWTLDALGPVLQRTRFYD